MDLNHSVPAFIRRVVVKKQNDWLTMLTRLVVIASFFS